MSAPPQIFVRNRQLKTLGPPRAGDDRADDRRRGDRPAGAGLARRGRVRRPVPVPAEVPRLLPARARRHRARRRPPPGDGGPERAAGDLSGRRRTRPRFGGVRGPWRAHRGGAPSARVAGRADAPSGRSADGPPAGSGDRPAGDGPRAARREPAADASHRGGSGDRPAGDGPRAARCEPAADASHRGGSGDRPAGDGPRAARCEPAAGAPARRRPPAAAPPVASPPASAAPPRPAAPSAPTLPASGDLAKTSAIHLYYLAASQDQTGLLTLKLADRAIEVHFRKGNPEYVGSSHPDDSLGKFLLGQKLVTAEQLAQAEGAKEKFGGELVSALFGLGTLNPATAFAQLAQRATMLLLRGALRRGRDVHLRGEGPAAPPRAADRQPLGPAARADAAGSALRPQAQAPGPGRSPGDEDRRAPAALRAPPHRAGDARARPLRRGALARAAHRRRPAGRGQPAPARVPPPRSRGALVREPARGGAPCSGPRAGRDFRACSGRRAEACPAPSAPAGASRPPIPPGASPAPDSAGRDPSADGPGRRARGRRRLPPGHPRRLLPLPR